MNNCCQEIFPDLDLRCWEVQCSSYMADADNYYTKYEVNEKLSEKLDASAYTPCDLTNYATMQWVSDQNYLTEHQPLKTINGQVISGSGNIQIDASGSPTVVDSTLDSGSTNAVANSAITVAINAKLDASAYTPTSLTNYYNKQEVDSLINAVTSRLVQNITNLQEQINSIISNVSGCCASSGETQYRWITMTGENDFWCDGTTKKTLEKQQSSTDGINWTDTNTIRSGSTVLEYNCEDCGYDITKGIKITLTNNTSIDVDCEDLTQVPCNASGNTIIRLDSNHILSRVTAATDVKQIEVGSCVDQINYDCFSGMTNLQKVIIPSTFESEYGIGNNGCKAVNVAAFEFTAIRSVGLQGSGADVEWNNNMTEIGAEMFKGCTALTTVELNENFKGFQGNVFSGCTNLQSITIHATELPILDSVPASLDDGLSNIGNNTFVIYVPSNMVDTYKNSTDSYRNWSKYASHIQPII